MKKVLILGAGPTGLVTGWELLKKVGMLLY